MISFFINLKVLALATERRADFVELMSANAKAIEAKMSLRLSLIWRKLIDSISIA